VICHPTKELAVTLGSEGRFKVWTYAESTWICRSVGTYSEASCTAGDFSEDGSLLAVSFNHELTLWNPLTNTLLETLPSLVPNDKIRFCKFISTYLICCTEKFVIVWSMLTLRPVYSFQANVNSFNVDLKSQRFLISTAINVTLFSVTSEVPLHTWRFNQIVMNMVLFTETEKDIFTIYVILKDLTICSINKKSRESSAIKELMKQETPLIEPPKQDKEAIVKNTEPTSLKKVSDIFDMPTHILPPIDHLYKLFMNALVLTDDQAVQDEQAKSNENNQEEAKPEVIDNMEIEESQFEGKYFDEAEFSRFFSPTEAKMKTSNGNGNGVRKGRKPSNGPN